MNWDHKKALKRIGIVIGIIPFGCLVLLIFFAALILGILIQIMAMALTILGFFAWGIMYLLGFDDMVWNKRCYGWLWQNSETDSGLVLWPSSWVIDLWTYFIDKFLEKT